MNVQQLEAKEPKRKAQGTTISTIDDLLQRLEKAVSGEAKKRPRPKSLISLVRKAEKLSCSKEQVEKVFALLSPALEPDIVPSYLDLMVAYCSRNWPANSLMIGLAILIKNDTVARIRALLPTLDIMLMRDQLVIGRTQVAVDWMTAVDPIAAKDSLIERTRLLYCWGLFTKDPSLLTALELAILEGLQGKHFSPKKSAEPKQGIRIMSQLLNGKRATSDAASIMYYRVPLIAQMCEVEERHRSTTHDLLDLREHTNRLVQRCSDLQSRVDVMQDDLARINAENTTLTEQLAVLRRDNEVLDHYYNERIKSSCRGIIATVKRDLDHEFDQVRTVFSDLKQEHAEIIELRLTNIERTIGRLESEID